MRAAIAGDIIGSRFEKSRWRGDSFETARCVGSDAPLPQAKVSGEAAARFELFHADCLLTDDSILTLAMGDWLLHGGDLAMVLKKHFRRSSCRDRFGSRFRTWAESDFEVPCGSVGNGAAMRVAPVAYAFESLEVVRAQARATAEVTHQLAAPILGAEAMALGVFLARKGETKEQIAREMLQVLEIDTLPDLNQIRDGLRFSSECRETIPISIRAFLDASSFEETIRRAISVGGDSDTIASMAAALAGAYWGTPTAIRSHVTAFLDAEQLELVLEFEERFPAAGRTIF
jgi:ADP-ribosylglycohydrolase